LKKEDCSKSNPNPNPNSNPKKYIRRINYDDDYDVRRYKRFKSKKEFESVLSDDTKNEEYAIILEHRPDPLSVINT
jgi:hypothetical protein